MKNQENFSCQESILHKTRKYFLTKNKPRINLLKTRKYFLTKNKTRINFT